MSLHYADNFANLAGWDSGAAGASVSGGQVCAAIAGTNFQLLKAFGAAGSTGRMAFNLIPNKADTAGRSIGAGFMRNDGYQGLAVLYLAGNGIIIQAVYNNGSSFFTGSTIIADASLTTGHTYHVELFGDGVLGKITARVYDNGTFVAQSEVSVPSGDLSWLTMANASVMGNSATSKLSAFAVDSTLFGTTTTAANFSQPCCATYAANIGSGQDGNRIAFIYTPAGLVTQGRAAFILHGAAQSVSSDLGSAGGYVTFRDTMLAAGVPVAMPAGYSTGNNSQDHWGSDEAYTEHRDVISQVNSLLIACGALASGSDVRKFFLAYSMGNLMLGRLIGYGNSGSSQTVNIGGIYSLRGVLSGGNFWNSDAAFRASMGGAWGGAFANAAAAHAVFDQFSVLESCGTFSGRFKAIPAIYLDYGSPSSDGVIDPATQGDATATAFASNGIVFTKFTDAVVAHTDAANTVRVQGAVAGMLANAVQPAVAAMATHMNNRAT